MLNTLISKSNGKISETEFRFDQLQKHFDDHNLQYAFGSKDATRIIKKIKYDSTTNTLNGFPTPLDCGVPIKEYYRTTSFDKLKLWFDSNDKSSLLNVHMIQPVPSTNQNIIPSPFYYQHIELITQLQRMIYYKDGGIYSINVYNEILRLLVFLL
ncbi:unnamed protein product, partial [Rotaria magnacalcarata]